VTQIYGLATLWIGLALIATLLSIWLRVATAMSEIIVGTVAQLVIGAALGAAALGTDQSWIKFLAGTGAVLLTFLAGTELDPQVMRREWKQAVIVGLVAFTAPFLGAQRWPAMPWVGAAIQAGSPGSPCPPHRSRSSTQ